MGPATCRSTDRKEIEYLSHYLAIPQNSLSNSVQGDRNKQPGYALCFSMRNSVGLLYFVTQDLEKQLQGGKQCHLTCSLCAQDSGSDDENHGHNPKHTGLTQKKSATIALARSPCSMHQWLDEAPRIDLFSFFVPLLTFRFKLASLFTIFYQITLSQQRQYFFIQG